MTKLNFFKKFLIFYLLIALIVQPALVGAASVRINRILIEKGISFTEIDRFKCYNGTSYIDENLLDPPYFNFSNYENLTLLLRAELDRLINNEAYGFKEYKIYNGSVPDLMFAVFDDNGDVYRFRSEDGYWWALSREIVGFDVNNSESLGQISEEYTKTRGNFSPIILSVEQAVKRSIIRSERKILYSFCEMESRDGEQNLLHLVNIYRPNNYFGEVGCNYSEGNLDVDCSESVLYHSINQTGDFWDFKDSKEQLTYKSGNNFIFLDRSDIDFEEGNRKAKTLGFMIVFSESKFFNGFGNGQSAFVGRLGHLKYLQSLDEIYQETQKIKSLNTELNDKIIELNNHNQELNNIFKSADDLEEKYDKSKSLPVFNASFIDENRIILVYYESYYDKKNILYERTINEYHGDYYREISPVYLEDLELEIRNLRSNLDQLEKRNDVYAENQRNILVNVQSQIDSLKIQKTSNFSIIATLLFATMVLFVSLSMSMLVHVSDKYSEKVTKIARSRMLFILELTFVVSLMFMFLMWRLGFSYYLLAPITLYILLLVYYVFRYMTNFLFHKNVENIVNKEDAKKTEDEK